MYHCVTRCVRRAWLCGIDPLTGADHEQRKQAVEARIRQLGEIFAVGIYAYAVMSNHLHVVLAVEPEAAAHWSDDQVAERWLRLFPVRDAERYEARRSTLLATIDRYRERLTDLSWFMKCLDEHIARRANAEDGGAHRDTHHLGTPGHAPPGAQGGGTPGHAPPGGTLGHARPCRKTPTQRRAIRRQTRPAALAIMGS